MSIRRDGQGPKRDVNRAAESRLKHKIEDVLYVGVDEVEVLGNGDTVRVTMSRFDLELALQAFQNGE